MSEYGTAKAYSAYLIDAGRKTTPPFSWRSTYNPRLLSTKLMHSPDS